GRYDVLVTGLHRAQLVQEIDHEIYREAEVELIPDYTPTEEAVSVQEIHQLLLEVFKKLSSSLPPDVKIYTGDDIDQLSPGTLTDIMASLLVNNPYDRQSL